MSARIDARIFNPETGMMHAAMSQLVVLPGGTASVDFVDQTGTRFRVDLVYVVDDLLRDEDRNGYQAYTPLELARELVSQLEAEELTNADPEYENDYDPEDS